MNTSIKGAGVNAAGEEYSNALQAASAEGHDAVVQLQPEKGADVNAQGREYSNVLQAASYKGRVAVVQLQLEKGRTPTHKVESTKGHETVVQLLLEKGAAVNALQAASRGI
jgi:ankyrin repeat protein